MKIAPNITVNNKPFNKPFLSFSKRAWCAQVTVVPDKSKINVLINGICQGSRALIPLGGQTDPITCVGNKLASKKAQNQATKNITSDIMNNVIPYLSPI